MNVWLYVPVVSSADAGNLAQSFGHMPRAIPARHAGDVQFRYLRHANIIYGNFTYYNWLDCAPQKCFDGC